MCVKHEYQQKSHRNAESIGQAGVCACREPPLIRFDPRLGETPMRLAARVLPHPESHFSAVLDHHYPQVVTFSLYACSPVNSRQEFRSETRKSSSESDDEDALRFARGSSR
jgi:hypothetical protein